MCAIYGQLGMREIDVDTAEKATDLLSHRGPDDRGTWSGPGVFLGMRRLSIIDLACGHQPIWNEDHTLIIVFNGELYNFRELRAELESRDHRFSTQSDTEVVLHAYEQWGVHCLTRFNGMFAFAIWNTKREELLLVRDRIGEKPLYYYTDDAALVFASEIKAILATATVPRQIDPQGLRNFFAFGHAVAPQTMYRGIRKLLPGHYLLATMAGIRTMEYWDVRNTSAPPSRNRHRHDEAYASQILTLTDDAVQRRMIADVPIGAFLSGGVDSSAIVALMKRHTASRVKTFSLGFTIGGAYNELPDAQFVARQLGTDHHELNVEHLDLVETLRRLVYHYDEPFGDPAAFPVYLLSQFARQHVKVVLSGEGGDELFGGYRRYSADQFARYYQFLPRRLSSGLSELLTQRVPRARRLKRTLSTVGIADPARRYASWLVLFTPEMQETLLIDGATTADCAWDILSPYSHYYQQLNGSAADHLNRIMYVDLKTWLPDAYLEKTDKATMACGLEARLPLLDHRLVELAFTIPSRFKVKGWSRKRIFKRAVGDLVPPRVLRKPKHGFAVPLDPWFRGELKEFTFEVLLDERTRHRGYFNSKFVEQLWKEHIEGRHVWDMQLWLLLNFELWHRIYLDREPV